MRAHIITVPGREESLAKVVQGFHDMPKLGLSLRVWEDKERKGPWWNTQRALWDIADRGEPGLIVQDDVEILSDPLAAHIDALTGYLTPSIGLISLFAPPQVRFDSLRQRNMHGIRGYEFLWAQMYLVEPAFATKVITTNTQLDQSKVTIHDEVRFRCAAQLHEVSMVTLCMSFCSHDLEVKSTMGTPSKIGRNVRNTRNFASVHEDLSNGLWLERGDTSKKDWEEYRAK